MIRALSTTLLLLLTPAVAAETISDDKLVVEAKLPTASYGLASGFDSLWSMQGSDLLRIDPDDNSIAKIAIPRSRSGIRTVAVGEGAVWLPDGNSDAIYKVDPATSQVTLTIPIDLPDASAATIGVGAGSIWVMSRGGGKAWVGRYSAATGAEEARIPVRASGFSVVFEGDAVWVSGTYKNEVYRIDPSTNTLVATLKVAGGPRQLTAGPGILWVQASGDGGQIHRIDPVTNEVVATIATETGLDDFASAATGGGYLWASYHEGFLLQVDPASNAIVRRYEGDLLQGYTIAFVDESIWLAGYGAAIYRITPPRQ